MDGSKRRTAVRLAGVIFVAAALSGCARFAAGSQPPSGPPSEVPVQSTARTPMPTPGPIPTAGPAIVGTTDVCEETIQELQPPTEEELSWFSHSDPMVRYEVETYGVSFEEAVRRVLASSDVEDLLSVLQRTRGDLVDAVFLDRPQFRAVIRTVERRSVEKICGLVADWPMEIAVQWGAPQTYRDLHRAYRTIGDWVFKYDGLPAGVRIFGVALDSVNNSVVLFGPEELSPDFIKELSDLAGGVYVRWELRAEPDTPRTR